MRNRRLLVLVLLCAGLAVVPVPCPAQSDACDVSIEPVSSSYGYRSRGGRCEGLYVAPTSSPRIELVSFLRGALRYELGAGVVLEVTSPGVESFHPGPVNIRAVALSSGTYYRMDAVLPSPEGLSWPVDEVLGPSTLDANRIGVFGWVERNRDRIFIPLAVRRAGASDGPESSLVLRVRPSVSLDVLYWRQYPDGRTAPEFSKARDTVYAGEIVELSLQRGPAGITRVDLSAKAQHSDDWGELNLLVVRPEIP